MPARRAGDDEGVRPRPPPADHQRLPRLSRVLRRHRRRANIAAPATAANAGAEQGGAGVRPRAVVQPVAGIAVSARPSVPHAIIVPRPRAGRAGDEVAADRDARDDGELEGGDEQPSRSSPVTAHWSTARSSSAAATITAARRPRCAPCPSGRCGPRRRRRGELDCSEPERHRRQAPRPTPNSSSSHGPNVTNSASLADIRPNTAITRATR